MILVDCTVCHYGIMSVYEIRNMLDTLDKGDVGCFCYGRSLKAIKKNAWRHTGHTSLFGFNTWLHYNNHVVEFIISTANKPILKECEQFIKYIINYSHQLNSKCGGVGVVLDYMFGLYESLLDPSIIERVLPHRRNDESVIQFTKSLFRHTPGYNEYLWNTNILYTIKSGDATEIVNKVQNNYNVIPLRQLIKLHRILRTFHSVSVRIRSFLCSVMLVFTDYVKEKGVVMNILQLTLAGVL